MTQVTHEVEQGTAELHCGDATLFRRWVRPAGSVAWARLLLIHGYGDHSGRYGEFLRFLAERGIEAHALDLRGQGRSSGRRGFVTAWSDYQEDVAAFLRCEELSAGGAPLFAMGHSHGALVLAALAERGEAPARGCILSAPFLRSRMHVPAIKVLLARLADPVLPWLPVHNGLRNEWMSADPAMLAESRADPLIVHTATPRWYLGCLAAQQEALRRAPELRVPLLVLMGENDPVADPAAAQELFERAKSEDKSYRSYPGMLHELLRERDRATVYADVLEWLRARAAPS